MSKIKRYIAFCEENGYTNRHGEVVSMKHAEEYMKTQQYAKEHDEYSLINDLYNFLGECNPQSAEEDRRIGELQEKLLKIMK